MPLKARTKSNTEIYHVVMRGIYQQRIFEDHLDYRKFLDKKRFLRSIYAIALFLV